MANKANRNGYPVPELGKDFCNDPNNFGRLPLNDVIARLSPGAFDNKQPPASYYGSKFRMGSGKAEGESNSSPKMNGVKSLPTSTV